MLGTRRPDNRARIRLIVIAVLVPILAYPLLSGMHYSEHSTSSYPSTSGFAGKVLLMVPPPLRFDNLEFWINYSIERANYIGADGIKIMIDGWWDNVELYRNTLKKYKDAGFLIAGHWGHHCEYPRYCLGYNPPIQDWALTHQHKQMATPWRIHIDGETLVSNAYQHANGQLPSQLNTTQNEDGSLTVGIRKLDYYEPIYGNGAVYNISSIYENYPASEFSWLYDESEVAYDASETPYENGTRLDYGTSYKLFIENNTLYATILNPGNRDFNLYVLFYVPSFPSVYFKEGRETWLATLRGFLGNFSEYIDAHFQNSGGFPVPNGDFNPEIIIGLESEYGIDFNFDHWVFDKRPIHRFDKTYLTQYIFERENYFIFKNYAREKQEIHREYDVIYVPTGSDMRHMLWAMIEHVDALLVNSYLDSYRIVRYGYSWGTKDWPHTEIRLGIWNSFILTEHHSKDQIVEWGFRTVDEALRWNPDGATLTFWTATAKFEVTEEQWEAFRDVTRYMHERFKHVRMLPSDVTRHTAARVYLVSHAHRYGPRIDLNPGQIDIRPIYIKDMRWDTVPSDGCLLYGDSHNAASGISRIDDTEAHENLIEAVRDGATIAFSANALRAIESYYKGTAISAMMNDMLQTESWNGRDKPGYSSHYLTFDGTFEPRHLNVSSPNGRWIQLRSNATVEVITGEFPYPGLYEAGFGKGRVVGFGGSSSPDKVMFNDANSFIDAESATYGDEYSLRFFEYCANGERDLRLWDVGKTFVYKSSPLSSAYYDTYYVLIVEKYGISRTVPLIVYGETNPIIVDMDSNKRVPNNSLIHLDADSTKLFEIKVRSH